MQRPVFFLIPRELSAEDSGNNWASRAGWGRFVSSSATYGCELGQVTYPVCTPGAHKVRCKGNLGLDRILHKAQGSWAAHGHYLLALLPYPSVCWLLLAFLE